MVEKWKSVENRGRLTLVRKEIKAGLGLEYANWPGTAIASLERRAAELFSLVNPAPDPH